MNILDVWFDSGSSHEAVLSVRPELTWPADIYLEGSDQHRGWFQSSLLVGLGTRGRPPFREVADPRLHRRRRRPEDVEVARQLDRAAGHHQAERRRHPAALGVDERLHAGDPAQQGDPGARRRGVPEDPQHAAVSASRTCTTSIRRRDRVAGRAAGRGRSLHPRAVRASSAGACCDAYDGVRLRNDLPGAERVRHRRSERVLRRRVEGSALHVRGAVARAALGADGDVPDGRRPDAPDGADPLVHRRRAVAVSARARARSRCTRASFPTARSSRRSSTRTSLAALGSAASPSRAGARRDRTAAEEQADRQLAAGQGRAVRCHRASSRCSSATRATLPMLFIVSEVELRPAPARRDAAEARRASRSSAPAA